MFFIPDHNDKHSQPLKWLVKKILTETPNYVNILS